MDGGWDLQGLLAHLLHGFSLCAESVGLFIGLFVIVFLVSPKAKGLTEVAGGEIELAPRILDSEAFPI